MRPVVLILLVGLSACVANGETVTREPVEHFRREGSRAPFSPAVRAGDTVYLSGMIGARPDGSFPEGIAAQTEQTMENIRAVLTMAGLDFDDIVRCTVMLENMSDWPAVNEVYRRYFKSDRLPARSAFGADGLALGALVEIECQAFAPEKRP